MNQSNYLKRTDEIYIHSKTDCGRENVWGFDYFRADFSCTPKRHLTLSELITKESPQSKEELAHLILKHNTEQLSINPDDLTTLYEPPTKMYLKVTTSWLSYHRRTITPGRDTISIQTGPFKGYRFEILKVDPVYGCRIDCTVKAISKTILIPDDSISPEMLEAVFTNKTEYA